MSENVIYEDQFFLCMAVHIVDGEACEKFISNRALRKKAFIYFCNFTGALFLLKKNGVHADLSFT